MVNFHFWSHNNYCLDVNLCFSILFRKHYLAEGGKLDDLKFRTPLYPLVPILGFGLYGIILVSLIFIPDQRLGIYCTVPFIIFCYTYYHFKVKKKLQLTLKVKLKLAKLLNIVRYKKTTRGVSLHVLSFLLFKYEFT